MTLPPHIFDKLRLMADHDEAMRRVIYERKLYRAIWFRLDAEWCRLAERGAQLLYRMPEATA